jgi:CHAT domain-containing protein
VLASGTALLEFAGIEASTSKSDGEPESSYFAFVLHAGKEDEVAMIDLGDAGRIDEMILKYKKELSQSGNGNADKASTTSKELFNIVFSPIEKALGNADTIFISPDGNLNLIPFEVLQKPDGRFLIEEYTFNYLAAGRDLLGFTDDFDTGNRCLLMGAPDFDLDPSKKTVIIQESKIDGKYLFAERSANLGELSFEPLHHAKQELEAIGEILGPQDSEIYIGDKALEEILMNKSGPEILHLATHGFFLGDQQMPGPGRGWQTAELPEVFDQATDRIEGEIHIENPLLRSGILLAGAKRSLLTGDAGINDGIVTAEKILGLNLHGTKMVVLSACDTGLGEVKSGEGVFGLRRAFAQAGAKSLVMSLWKVPDRETKELMVQFYRNLNSGELNRCQALRQATLDQIEIVRQRYGHDNPRYWGAFVFMGQP